MANRFKKRLLVLLEKRGQLHLLEKTDGRKEILNIIFKTSNPSDKEVNNFQSLMKNPSSLPVLKEKKKYKQHLYKEGTTLNNKRSKVTNTTLASSKLYQDPKKKYD